MNKPCLQCNTSFQITKSDLEFYRMMNVPAPTRCPQCRMIRRLGFYNTRCLYNDECDLCGKAILSCYSPDKPNPVYCNPCWWSDKWEATKYGVDYDFSRPFFEQFNELLQRVPMMAVNGDTPTMENSDYCMNAGHLKNCYLAFHVDYCENLYYSDDAINCKDCFDCIMIEKSELCFQSVNILNCYKAIYSIDCKDSRDIYFSKNLSGCHDCFGCVNLRNVQYCWFNEPLEQAEYEQRLADIDLSTQSALEEQFSQASEFWMKHPAKYMHGFSNENVSGDYIEHSKNVHQSFSTLYGENCKYTMLAVMKSTKDAYDYLSWGNNAERIYECVAVGENVYNMKFSYHCWPDSQDCEYCVHNINSSNLFGCVGLRKKQYFIFNKSYNPIEYFELVERIKQHMMAMPYIDNQGHPYTYGEFFPPETALFEYNETLAQSFFPLDKTEATAQGFSWYDSTATHILNTPETISCAHQASCMHECKRAFKIVPQEQQFYNLMKLATPELCPNCRYHERIKYRNPAQLWQRQCMCQETDHKHSGPCSESFQTSYSPRNPQTVYCESCYRQTVL